MPDICESMKINEDPGNADIISYECKKTGKDCNRGNCPLPKYNGIAAKYGKLE